mgnify:CR=1 FL=1
MAKIVAIANQKGGVGKTTTAVNLSSCVAALGKRVLIVDLDPQGNTTTGYGIPKRSVEKGTYEILIGEARASEAIRKTGRPVVNISIQSDGGVTKAIADGIKAVNELKEQAAAQKREPCPTSGLIISGYNGGSDWTSGLSANPAVGEAIDMHLAIGGKAVQICGRGGYPTNAGSYEIGMRLMEIGDFFNEDCTRRGGKGLSQVNPTPGNKAGGLTCLEEKSLGCIHKGGHSPVNAVYDYGKQVEAKQGLVIMDTPGNDPASVAAMVAGGAQVVVFSSGRGSPVGHPIVPVVKITGNKLTFAAMEDNIDFSAAPLIYGEKTVEELGEDLLKMVIETACGKQTKAEALGFVETAIARICNYV